MATIVATAVLYNILLQQNDIMPEDQDILYDHELFQKIQTLLTRQLGNAARSNLINNVFC